MEKVILESPYAGDYNVNESKGTVKINEIYGALAMYDCMINYDEAPFASHLLYTRKYVLRDNIPSEREIGIKAGFEWRNTAEKTVFYVDLGMTRGMVLGKKDCEEKEIPYEIRELPTDLWEKFLNSMEKEGIEVIRVKKKG